MRFPLYSIRAAVTFGGLVGLVGMLACSNGPTVPTPPPTTPTTTTATPSALAVSCDTSALGALGQSAQCHAKLTLSDASTQDQTAKAQWTSSDASRISVSAGGVIAAVAPGSADITASLQGLAAQQKITVSSACAFSISPTSVSFPASGGSQIVTLTATPSGCSPSTWTATSPDSALTFAPTAGEGSASVTVRAAANTGGAVRRTVTIGGQSLTVELAEAPAPSPMRTLSLTLTQGENLGGPWAGTVTATNGYSCTLALISDNQTCPPLGVADGTKVELVVALLPQYANLGSPIWHTTGCDTATNTVCRVLMNGDKRVTIAIGAL